MLCLLSIFNPISTWGAWNPLPERLVQHYSKTRKVFSSNLLTSVIDKWVTVSTVKLKDRPFPVAMAMAQVKEVKNDIFEKIFSILTLGMDSATIN